MSAHILGRKPAIELAATLVLSGFAGAALAATDGYGNTLIESSATGSGYGCVAPITLLAPNDRFCNDDPFVAVAAGTDVFSDPRGTLSGQAFYDAYVGNTVSSGSITANAAQIIVYEGNNVGSSFTIGTDGAGAASALFKNYAVGATIATANGGAVFLSANNADGATLTTSGGSQLYLKGNSADGATITTSDTSVAVIDGNSAKNAQITNNGSAQLTIIHSDATGASIALNGGVSKIYGSQAADATLTVAAGASLEIGDCSAAVGCTDSRATTMTGSASSLDNSGTVSISGTIDLAGATITNRAGGVLNAAGGAINGAGVSIHSDGAVNVSGDTALAVNVVGAGQINIDQGVRLAVQPGYSVNTSAVFIADGGSMQLTADLAAQTANTMTVASTVMGAGAVTLQINPVNSGAPTAGLGILVVSVSGGAAASAVGAFQMAPFTSNGFIYSLVRDAGNGNWYLRSASAAAAVPTLGETALALLGLVLAGLGATRLRRRCGQGGRPA